MGKAQYVLYMVCGSLGELTKLRAYGFSFGFRYFRKQREELVMMVSHTPQLQFLSWELIPLVDMFGYSCDTVFFLSVFYHGF